MKRPGGDGAWVLIFPGLLFGAICFYMGTQAGGTVREWSRMRGWTEVSARILQAHSSQEGKSHKVAVAYAYSYAGVEYHGSRIGINGNRQSARYLKEWAARLLEAYRVDRHLPCYVNPHQPERSVLDRSVYLPVLIMQCIFCVCAGSVVVLMILVIRRGLQM